MENPKMYCAVDSWNCNQISLGSHLSASISLIYLQHLINEKLKRVDINCSTIDWLTLLAGNQLLDTKFINCLNPVNPGSTGFEQLTKK
jgi:hypothetical protein